MRNYESRFRLPNGKWAYIQLNELTEFAKSQIQRVQDNWTAPKYFFHLRRGGHVAALKLHRRNSWYGKLDLNKFFSTISRHRLTRCLKKIGYSFRDAEDFAVASTVFDHKSRRFALPFGFVQSPILASLALDKSALGQSLDRLYRDDVTLSVYVDDIIVSADNEDVVTYAIGELRRAADRSGFRINETKSGGPSESLQAFNIRVSGGEMEILEDRFAEMFRDVQQNGIGPVSDGVLNYVRSVNETQADHIEASFSY